MPLRQTRAALLLLSIGVPSLAPLPAFAQAVLKETVPHITESGYAEAEVVPDIAVLTVGVTTKRKEASQAASDNAAAVQALLSEIKSEGIDPKDVKTISAELAPVFEEQRDATGRLIKRTQTGYEASQRLQVRVRALDRAGVLAIQLIKKGANELQSVHYDYEHKAELYDRLRGEAMKDAIHRAKDHVTAAGISLGRILEIAPENAGERFKYPSAAAMPLAPRSEVPGIPMAPGTLTFTSQVQVVWELQP
jgi:uncharacterized protein YggE